MHHSYRFCCTYQKLIRLSQLQKYIHLKYYIVLHLFIEKIKSKHLFYFISVMITIHNRFKRLINCYFTIYLCFSPASFDLSPFKCWLSGLVCGAMFPITM